MSSLTELFATLETIGVRLGLDDAGNIRIRGKKTALTRELIDQIKANKPLIQAMLAPADDEQEPVIEVVDKDNSELLLSYAQQRLWLLDAIEGDTTQYHIPVALKLSGTLNLMALNLAFSEILDRHESLRTVFVENEPGEPRQQIQAASDFDITIEQLEGAVTDSKVTAWLNEHAGKPFDLSRDCMMRVNLLQLAQEEYAVLVTVHHIASDGWSMGLLVKEFSALYSAYVQGEVPELLPLEIQYADYAQWQRQWLSGDRLDAQLNYWQKELDGIPAVHGLRLDNPRPQQQTFAGAIHRSSLDALSTALLNDICLAQDATLFMGLHAAFSTLLARYSNATDIVVGTPTANREQAQVAELVGFFVNTLVLRSDLSDNPDFVTLLDHSKRSLLGAYAHQQVPFEQVVERLQPQRSLSHSPLFQIMLGLQNNEENELALPGLTLSALPQTETVAKFELTMMAREVDDTLVFEWEYNTGLFDAATIEKLAHSFNQLLQALVRNPEQKVLNVECMSDQERHTLLAERNNSQASWPQDLCVHQWFEQQVGQNPDKIALRCKQGSLSYQALNDKANQLAHYLMENRGVKPETLVGVCMARSMDMVVAMLAIHKAGGAYVPLDPAYPAERIEYMLSDANLTTVIAKQNVVDSGHLNSEQALCLDDDALQQQLGRYSQSNIDGASLGFGPDNLSHVIYTSGSTGKPKGVQIAHRNTVAMLSWAHSVYADDKLDAVLASTSICFDLSVFEIFAPLTCSGSAVIVENILELQSPDFNHHITLINTVPSAIQSLLAIDAIPTSVVTVNLAGEKLKQGTVDKLYDLGHIQAVYDLYGPSEDTTYSTYALRTPGGISTIGKSISNTQLYVLSDDLALVPDGVPGELCIAGAGLSRGYLNQPQLTAEKFVDNPFYGEHEGAGVQIYRTGDLVRWLEDGQLEYLGRIDDQVKIRGFRIELGEIEHCLQTLPQVKDAVVVAVEDERQDKVLVGYVVAKAAVASQDEFCETLKLLIAKDLPEHMVPARWLVLDAMPLTPNGKIDKKRLPKPDALAHQSQYVAPQTELEQQLCEAWQTVLGIAQVGRTDNFFALGGHSLLAVQVISLLRKQGVTVNAGQLFATASLAELAQRIELDVRPGAGFKAPENRIAPGCEHITPQMLPLLDISEAALAEVIAQVPGGAANVEDIYPLGPLQQGILFHHMLNLERDVYVLSSLYKVNNHKALSELLSMLQFIVDRHDVLRTAVIWQGVDEPVQVVCREAKLPVQWTKFDDDGQMQAFMDNYQTHGSLRMALDTAPLLQVEVAQVADNEQYAVLLKFHHIISDHVGLEIILKELAYYQAGQADQLPKPVPYREFIAYTRHQGAGHDAESFFQNLLGDVNEPTAPFGLTDVQGDGSEIEALRVAVPDTVSSKIRLIAAGRRMSPAVLFHTAWALVVSACSGRDDVVFGTVLSGRLQGIEGAEHMMGVFINTLPFRVKLEGDISSVVSNVEASLKALLPYEQSSLALMQRCSGLASEVPLFSAVLNYRHSAPVNADVDDASADISMVGSEERANYPFDVSVDDLGEGFELDIQVHQSVGAKRIAEYMQTAVNGLVEALSAHVPMAASQVPVLPQAEQQKLLNDWNDTKAQYPQQQCIHQLFEQQAQQRPDAVALTFEDSLLSYAQLNAAANRLAHYLISHCAVGPDVLVGLCMERSSEMLIGLLAIVKAGGAYVPIGADYPEARIDQIIEDAGLVTVLSHQAVAGKVALNAEQVVCVDEAKVADVLASQPESNPAVQGVTPSSLAYVIYTSGFNGQAQGRND